MRELDDEELASALRRQGRRIHITSLIVAALVTGALVFLPV